jgi:hypothetical protein
VENNLPERKGVEQKNKLLVCLLEITVNKHHEKPHPKQGRGGLQSVSPELEDKIQS